MHGAQVKTVKLTATLPMLPVIFQAAFNRSLIICATRRLQALRNHNLVAQHLTQAQVVLTTRSHIRSQGARLLIQVRATKCVNEKRLLQRSLFFCLKKDHPSDHEINPGAEDTSFAIVNGGFRPRFEEQRRRTKNP